MIGFGMIGCGRISERHIASLAACPEGELVAVGDLNVERTRQAREAYMKLSGVKAEIAVYHDVSQMLQDTRVQVVVIATHSSSHSAIAQQALESGRHVIIEKPMALSLLDAESLVRLAESRGLLLHVCHQLRYKPVLKQLKELIASGAMGHIYLGVVSMRLSRFASYYEAAPWRGTWNQDGGMLLNQGIHLVDLLQWYMGEPEEAYGRLQRGPLPKQTEDAAAGIIKFRSSGIGMIEANTITVPKNLDNCLSLFGEKGTVSIGGIQLNQIRRWSFHDETIVPCEDEAADEHVTMYVNIIQKLQNKEADIISGSEGQKALELIFSLYHSHRIGQACDKAPSDFTTSIMATMEGWS